MKEEMKQEQVVEKEKGKERKKKEKVKKVKKIKKIKNNQIDLNMNILYSIITFYSINNIFHFIFFINK